MSSTNKTSLGLNMWEASDKPVRQDFVNDNTIIDEKITNLNSNLAVNSGSVYLTGAVFTSGIMYYQNFGKNAHLSFVGLKLANDFPSGTWITIFILDNDGRPVVPTRSAMVCSGSPLYLNVETSGEIVVSNYSGITLVAGSVIEGGVSYVIA